MDLLLNLTPTATRRSWNRDFSLNVLAQPDAAMEISFSERKAFLNKPPRMKIFHR